MSGAYSVIAGGIFVSGTVLPATPDESDRHIHLMIYQLTSYMNAKELGVPIQNAARQVLGGDPNPGEIQATFVDSGDLPYFATDIRLTNLNDRTYAVGISPTETDSGQSVPNPYVLDMQDLTIVLTVLQLSDTIFNRRAHQPVFAAAFAALKVLSDHLNERAENQGWKYS